MRGDHVQVIAALRPPADGAGERRVPSRLGLSVSRGVGGSPQRARLRRLLREAFRRLRGALRADCDLVILAKTPWPDAGLADVAAEMALLLGRMRLMRVDGGRGAGGSR